MAKKASKWVQEIIDEYLPKFGKARRNKTRQAQLSQEIIDLLRHKQQERGLAAKSLKKPLTDIKKALELNGHELSASFSPQEWDEMGDATARQEYREQKTEEEEKLEELIQYLQLDTEEVNIVQQASQKSSFSIKELLKRGLIIEAKTQLTKAENEASFSNMTSEEVAATNSKQAPQELAKRAIEAIIEHNDYRATEKDQKWYISQGFVSNFLKEKLGVNVHLATVKKVIQQQKIRIADHNSKHELVPTSNRKGANSPWSIDGIEFN